MFAKNHLPVKENSLDSAIKNLGQSVQALNKRQNSLEAKISESNFRALQKYRNKDKEGILYFVLRPIFWSSLIATSCTYVFNPLGAIMEVKEKRRLINNLATIKEQILTLKAKIRELEEARNHTIDNAHMKPFALMDEDELKLQAEIEELERGYAEKSSTTSEMVTSISNTNAAEDVEKKTIDGKTASTLEEEEELAALEKCYNPNIAYV
ncbi:hypothetical protein RFI_14403 [Reticulomyxa filosa]|uniref:Uncharacterized protein n=1 Tax=Reticulomyxa filosa TaxID=46433 RepID=X6N9T5_RETFI|nr:hypothetical protein RFI_14403 [Reticulomyxa filosa]|eukprot:ETO22791.1 hypothetical protein RFI_14403 [Reticulomyxa filosa]